MSEPWIHPPQQARSRRTLERLLDAACALLEDREFEDVSVAEIAERADLSVGTFYRRVQDKDALLHVLDEELRNETSVLLDVPAEKVASDGGTLAEVLRPLLEPVVRSYFQRRGVRRALLLRSRTDPSLRERAAETEREGARALQRFLSARPEFRDWSEDALRRRCGVLVVQLVGFLREVVLFRELQVVEVPCEPDAVLDAAVDLVAGTIGAWVPARSERAQKQSGNPDRGEAVR